MSSKVKGSELEELLSVESAADILQTTARTVRNMVKQGLLKPVYVKDPITGREVQHFQSADVFGAASARLDGVDAIKAANLATRAMAIAQQNQQQVQALLDVLGFQKSVLDFTQEGAMSLFAEAEEALHSPLPLSEQTTLKWARVLMQISEEYLDLIRQISMDPEPWKVFLLLGERLAEDLQESTGSTRDKVVLYLSGARRHFRNTAYFYVRTRESAPNAFDKIGEPDRLDDAIINLMFLH